MAVDKYALLVGINQYSNPNANLSGCVNDAKDWDDLLQGLGYKTTLLLDSDATRENILAALKEHVDRLGYRDRLVFQYSGHGSWIPDRNGDEVDGRDEVLVAQDMRYISDDDLYPIFSSRAYASRVVTLSDSCHSGTITRYAPDVRVDDYQQYTARFLSPIMLHEDPDDVARASQMDARRFTTANGGVLISGAADYEYSYDASFGFDQRPNGAFTRAAIDTWAEGLNYREWHARIRGVLPNERFPQSPQLGGTAYQTRVWKALD